MSEAYLCILFFGILMCKGFVGSSCAHHGPGSAGPKPGCRLLTKVAGKFPGTFPC